MNYHNIFETKESESDLRKIYRAYYPIFDGVKYTSATFLSSEIKMYANHGILAAHLSNRTIFN